MTSNDYYGINLVKEDDYSAISTALELWLDGIPLKPGDTFPASEMKRRADIVNTMDALVSNELQEPLQNYINDMPDLSPMESMRITNIVSSLPIFDTLVSSWKSILVPCFKGVEVKGIRRDDIWQILYPHIERIIRNMFTCCDRATAVYTKEGRIKLKVFTDKNIMLFRTQADDRVVTITNIVKEKKTQKLECISYLPSGVCVRDVFMYNAGKVGKHIVVNEVVDEDRYILFAKNGSGEKDYGYPELIGSISASLGVIRAFSILARSVEQAKEEIKLMPNSALRCDPITGATYSISGATVTYDENNTETKHEVAIVKPVIDFEGLCKALEIMLKQVAIYSHLSGTILGFETMSGNVSGRMLLASCIPTMLHANGYIDRLNKELTTLVVEVAKYMDDTVAPEDVKLIVEKPDTVLLDIVNGAMAAGEPASKNE